MKISRAAVLATMTLSLFLASPSFAQSAAAGSFIFDNGVGKTRIEFTASSKERGTGDGAVGYAGPVEVVEDESDEVDPKRFVADLTMKLELDCVTIEKTRAAMSGVVRDASLKGMVGRTFMLVVEDGAEGTKDPDRYSWGFYGPQQLTWVPEDAEVKGDNGWSMQWYATDAERPDDRGVLNGRSADIRCESFNALAHDLIDLDPDAGSIQIR